MDAQHSNGQGMEKSEAINGQSNYPANQNYPPPPIKEDPPSYQSSVVEQNDLNFDPENVKRFDFDDESIRRNFIRKVFTLLGVQLTITFVIVFLIAHPKGLKHFMLTNLWIFFLGIFGLIIAVFTIAFSERFRRTYPYNMIFLCIITVCKGITIGYIAALHKPDVVLTALGFTVIMVFALSFFAVQTKYDFTKWGGALFIAILMFCISTFIAICTRSDIQDLILSSIGVTLFSVYLIYCIQIIIGGKHKYQLSPEEYILATLILYLSILRIFRHSLRIVSILKRK